MDFVHKLPSCNLFHSRNFSHFHHSKFVKIKASRLSNLQAHRASKVHRISLKQDLVCTPTVEASPRPSLTFT